jgi:hypothetical protein
LLLTKRTGFLASINQMEKLTLGLLVLFGVLLVSQVLRVESFTDASDNSGNNITLSLTDLLSLIGSTTSSGSSTPPPPPQQPVVIQAPGIDSQFYTSFKSELLSDVRQAVQDEMISNPLASQGTVLEDSCIDSFSGQQGKDFLKYVPGKNPNDYIRKDSIPCYGCSLP